MELTYYSLIGTGPNKPGIFNSAPCCKGRAPSFRPPEELLNGAKGSGPSFRPPEELLNGAKGTHYKRYTKLEILENYGVLEALFFAYIIFMFFRQII